jgi:chromosome partitioning protein
MATTSRISVMEGTLGEVSLADLLQVVSIGRQYTAIELRQEDQTPTATLFLKSGKLISAAGLGTRGKEAFLRLFPTPRATTFHVFRTETPSSLPEPIGPIGLLLLEALDRSANSPRPAATAARAVRDDRVSTSSRWLPPPSKNDAPSSPVNANLKQPGAANPAPAVARPSSPRMDPAVQVHPTGVGRHAYSAGHVAVPPVRAPEPVVPRRPLAERGGPPIVLAIASPKGGSGKTTLALNLAVTLARLDYRVVLVDGDVNGDILSAIDARGKARAGTFDVLMGNASIDDALLGTVMPNFKIMPAWGATLPDPSLTLHDHAAQWSELLASLEARHDFVIVDTPSGMLGVSHLILQSATHVLGVLQAEVMAQRSFAMFAQGLDALPANARPRVLGVVLNMVQPSHPVSVSVLQRACSSLPKAWLFETSIPRSPVFLEASEIGLPLRMLDERSPPAVAWLFEMLATEAIERLHLPVPERRAQRLLIL